MSGEVRYVSNQTENMLHKIEADSNGTKIGVVIENNEKEEQIENFKQQKSVDITSKLGLDDIGFGVSLLKKNKGEKTMNETIKNEGTKFVSFSQFADRVQLLTSKKTGDTFYKIGLRFSSNGEMLPKGRYYYILLNSKRLSKKYNPNSKFMPFWLFNDEQVMVYESVKDKDTGEWSSNKLGTYGATTIVVMAQGLPKD